MGECANKMVCSLPDVRSRGTSLLRFRLIESTDRKFFGGLGASRGEVDDVFGMEEFRRGQKTRGEKERMCLEEFGERSGRK